MTPAQIADAQRRLGLRPTCRQDEELWLAVRRFQTEQGLLVTGELDDATYARLWESRLVGPGPAGGGSHQTRAEGDVTTL